MCGLLLPTLCRCALPLPPLRLRLDPALAPRRPAHLRQPNSAHLPADAVLLMDSYQPLDVTEQAQAIAARHGRSLPRDERYGDVTPRTLLSGGAVKAGVCVDSTSK